MALAKAGKGHLIVGSILVALALASAIAVMITDIQAFAFAVFFFGVWGGVEIGRVVEAKFREE